MSERDGVEFESVDYHLSELLGTEPMPVLREVIALLSRSARDGDSCLDLENWAGQVVEGGRWHEALPARSELEHALLGTRAVVRAEGLELRDDSGQPFVLDEAGRLYLRRFYQAEREVARHFLRLVRGESFASSLDPKRVDAYFKPSLEPDLQRRAVEVALGSGVTLITGGPGTGKTTTVVKFLVCYVEQEQLRGHTPRIGLLAPTGKAADRLLHATESSLKEMDVPAEVMRALPREASTVHRALEPAFRNGFSFRRNADSPLPYDCVILDEASMVDLTLIVHLLRALKTGTRLVLLGDEDQLASVETGAVLTELLRGLSLLEREGRAIQFGSVRLTKSYRFTDEGGLATLFSDVRAGHAKSALARFEEAKSAARFVESTSAGRFELSRVLPEFVEQFEPVVRSSDPEEALQKLSSFRVLSAVRQGPFGVIELNSSIAAEFAPRSAPGGYFAGQPLLVTRNDSRLGLFNGDVGIVGKLASGELASYFSTADGKLRRIPLAALPEHESAFALTVHKSQGSEYDRVAFVLPDLESSALLCRELIYTALTRARRSLLVFGDKTVFARGVERRTSRSSALAERLIQMARIKFSTP